MALTPARMLKRGFARRCPVCGEGHLFRHWVQMAPTCPHCGLAFRRLPGHWLGSWFLNICVAQAAVVAVLVIGVAVSFPDPPMVLLTVLVVVVALAVPFGFFPFSRTIWSAIDLSMRPLEFDDGVPPGFELEDEADDLREDR